jgi:hypothetical protein
MLCSASVEPQEIDSALDELENRLDRLRSLYEQYFMGIEKIEPTVPRKDVDRRFWILRRTQIRNTARRFRLQTLVQRYNTFQQHWTRICREIENGTYVRHLLKARKNLGAEPKTWAAKKRLGLLRRDRGASDAPPAREAGANGTSERPSAMPSSPPSMPASVPAPSEAPSARPRTSVRPSLHADLAPLDLELDDAPTLPPRGAPPKPATAVPPKPATVPKPAVTAAPSPAVVRPGIPAAPIAPAKPAIPAAPKAPAKPSGLPLPRPAGASMIPAVPRPRPSLPPAAPKAPAPDPAAPRPPSAQQTQGATAAPRAPAAPAVPNAPAAPPAAQPATPARPAAPLAPRPPSPERPVPAPAPRPAASTAPRPASGGSLSDERVRQLHEELNAARKQLNQSSNLSIDSLAKSLRDTETKLRTQHGGRSVDFQVVIKDGKPIVKPVVRR